MSRFVVYTYQFSPIINRQQSIFDNDLQPLEMIMKKKQDFFEEIFNNESLVFKNKKFEYLYKKIYHQDHIIIFRIANNKYQNLEENFHIKKHTYSPSCLVIIDNRYNIQHIAVEEDSVAFSDTQSVIHILSYTFARYLKQNRLRIEIQKEFQNSEFWNLIQQYPKGISMVRFNFSYPNLPRVTSSIDKMISEASRMTNSQQTTFEFKSATDNQLTLNRRDRKLAGLAKAAADSGNIITVRAKGIRHHIKTGKTEKSFEIDNIEVLLNNDLIDTVVDKLLKILNRLK